MSLRGGLCFVLTFVFGAVIFSPTVNCIIGYECLKNEVLIVNARDSERIRMRCSRPNICLDRLTCKYDDSLKKLPHCGGRRNFVAGVFQRTDQDKYYLFMCQCTNAVKLKCIIQHKCCKTASENPNHVKNDCFTHKLLDSQPEAYTVNGSEAESKFDPEISFSMDEDELNARPFQLKLVPLSSASPPVFLVKGIAKIRGGYQVTFCLINCDLFATGERQKTTRPPSQTTEKPAGNNSQSTSKPKTASSTQTSRLVMPTSDPNKQPNPDPAGGKPVLTTLEPAKPTTAATTTAMPDSSKNLGVIKEGETEGSSGGTGTAGIATGSETGSETGSASGSSSSSSGSGGTNSETGTGSQPGSTLQNAPSGFPNPLFANVMAAARRAGCFSGDMTVATPEGIVPVESLQVGQEVLVAKGPGTLIYEPVEWFYHKDPNETALYLNIVTESGRRLSLTPTHLIISSESCAEDIPQSFYEINKDFSRFASKMKVGNCILTKLGQKFFWDPVVSIGEEFKTGVHSPMTATGTIVVNDVHVSCYSFYESHAVQQLAYRLLKAQWKLGNAIQSYFLGHSSNRQYTIASQGVPKLVEMLIPLAHYASQYQLLL